ncbi:MAG: tRNA preQ1(34) S-adenosylmethionine ribosyltransferase-isomerase QueA [Cytophagales bacterium]|nr:tRNA preQ1(34) S-adenosylmethionine ribosyltransferase-isomerase QueA [Armatimonadota bacterium]
MVLPVAAQVPPVRLSEYDYLLPDERVAQKPVTPRDSSRLLVVPRESGELQHRIFRDLPDYLRREDVLVVNETRVTAVRLLGTRESGGTVEALTLRPAIERGPEIYEALVRPGKKLQTGEMLRFEEARLSARVEDRTESGGRFLRFTPLDGNEEVALLLEARGRVPLPPYITAPLEDRGRYQTVYAQTPGSAAAPTAGLHFTPELLNRIETLGIRIARIRLEVGLGTFRPIRVENIADHEMHRETFSVSQAAADLVNGCQGRVVAVGTTALRALETAAQSAPAGDRVAAVAEGETALFVTPGYSFRAVDALVTNFHQPHSTLLLLVAAFAGGDQMRRAYQTALQENYRFLSFGDAMLVH